MNKSNGKNCKKGRILFALQRFPSGAPKKKPCHDTVLNPRGKIGIDVLKDIIHKSIPSFKSRNGRVCTKKIVVFLEMDDQVGKLSLRAQVKVEWPGTYNPGAQEVCGLYEVEIIPNHNHSTVLVRRLVLQIVHTGRCGLVLMPEVKLLP